MQQHVWSSRGAAGPTAGASPALQCWPPTRPATRGRRRAAAPRRCSSCRCTRHRGKGGKQISGVVLVAPRPCCAEGAGRLHTHAVRRGEAGKQQCRKGAATPWVPHSLNGASDGAGNLARRRLVRAHGNGAAPGRPPHEPHKLCQRPAARAEQRCRQRARRAAARRRCWHGCRCWWWWCWQALVGFVGGCHADGHLPGEQALLLHPARR